jgi:hypothetical protein
MDENEMSPKAKKLPELGPEASTRSLIVSMGRKVLSDIVLGFSAMTVIGVLRLLQSDSESIVLYGLENFTTAALSMWIIFLLLSVIPNDLYERINTIEKFSIKQIALGASGIVFWYATFFAVTHFVTETISRLAIVAGK